MKEIEIKGNTIEKKLKSIEVILRRFGRRLHKTVIGAMPPVPLFFFIEKPQSDGTIAEWLLPVGGTITKLCMYIGDIVKDSGNTRSPVMFAARIISPTLSRDNSFEMSKNLLIEKVHIPVDAGSRITLAALSPERISNIWVSILLEIGIKDSNKEVFLIESFEKLIEKELEEDFTNGQE